MSSKVYATVNQFVGHGGISVWLGEGDEYDSSDPLVQAHPQFFTEAPSVQAAVKAARSARRASNG